MTERQEYIKFIKWLYPIGSVIDDWTCSEPYIVNKRTVFNAHPWKSVDYNDQMRPENDEDYTVEFTCHNPGKHTRVYTIGDYYEKRHILSKYRKEKSSPWLSE